MTRAPFSADELNAAVNAAARGMTSVPPSPDLRARVMTRIDAAQPRWGWRFAIAGGAIGAVTLTAAVLWRTPGSSSLNGPVTTPATSIAQSADMNPTAAPIVSSPLRSTASAPRPTRQRVVFAPSAAELEWRARAVPAMERPSALIVEPLEPSPLSIEPLDISPLNVAPLTVSSLAGNK